MFLSAVVTGAYAINHLSAYTAPEDHEHSPADPVQENVQPATCEGLVLLTWWFIVRNVVQNSLVPIIRQIHLVTTIETG